MRISTKGRYGIRLMLCLGLQYGKGHISLKVISKEQGISEKYLEQIISPLSKAGLVISFRGAQGGYSLTKSPEQISVGEILRTLEGSLSPVDCLDKVSCDRTDSCASVLLWKRMKFAVDEVVDNTTLADLVKEYNQKNNCKK